MMRLRLPGEACCGVPMARTDRIDFGRLIADAPFGRFHLRLIALCFAIAAVDGFDTQCIAFVAPALHHEWAVSRAAFGPLFSAGLLGTMIGAMALGSAADRYGRKPLILASVTLFGVMSLLSATASSIEVLGVYRFIGGLGLGGVIPNIIALVSEYAPQRHRATAVVAMFCGFPLGAVLGGAVSAPIITTLGWQYVFVLGGILPLALLVIAAYALPESARFLADHGRREALAATLARLGASGASLETGPGIHGTSRQPLLPMGALFTEGRAGWTALLWTVSFLGMLLTYFLINWTPLLLAAAGFPQEKAIMAVVLLNGGGIVGGLVLGRLADRLSVFAILAIAFAIGTAIVAALGATIGVSLWLTLALTCLTGLSVFGAQMNFPGLSANYYPVQVRSTGAGCAMAFGRVGSVTGPLVGGALIALGLETRELLLLAAVPAALAALVIASMARRVPGRPSGRVHSAEALAARDP